MALRPAAWEDLDAVVELLGTRNRLASSVPKLDRERLRADWALPAFDLGADAAVVPVDGRIAGYGALAPNGELTLASEDGSVARALLDELTARGRARALPTLTVTAQTPDGALGVVLERRGFVRDRETILMWCRLGAPVEELPVPEGMSLRTFEPGDAAAVHRLLDESYLAWDRRYVPRAHGDWVQSMTGDPEFDPTVWWLAERGATFAGCALHWSSGWLKDVAVGPAERGRGLGAALVTRGLAEFARRGVPRVGLKVDGSNPTGAARLYERLGFVAASTETVWRLAL